MHPGEHVVQTYTHPETLRVAIGAWVERPLRQGGNAIMVCTPEHADLVRDHLVELGIDVERCVREGHLQMLDAETLLERFLIDGVPQGAAFRRTIRGVLARAPPAPAAAGPTRVWGEMVDILVKRGALDASHRLEKLWCELLVSENAELLCSYDLHGVDPDVHARLLLHLCATHSDIVTEEGPALDCAVALAMSGVFGEEAAALRRVLPTRRSLLARMSIGSATLLSLRAIHPQLGEEVARRARALIPGPAHDETPLHAQG